MPSTSPFRTSAPSSTATPQRCRRRRLHRRQSRPRCPHGRICARYPGYSFCQNKGYPTPEHKRLLQLAAPANPPPQLRTRRPIRLHMVTTARQRLGEFGERIAAHHLEAAGMVVIARNTRTPGGEIDLIAADGEDIVFVEVRTRRAVPGLAADPSPRQSSSACGSARWTSATPTASRPNEPASMSSASTSAPAGRAITSNTSAASAPTPEPGARQSTSRIHTRQSRHAHLRIPLQRLRQGHQSLHPQNRYRGEGRVRTLRQRQDLAHDVQVRSHLQPCRYHRTLRRPLRRRRRPDAYKDPRQIGSWVEKKFDEYGMDLPDGAREMIDAAREGDFPDPVKDL